MEPIQDRELDESDDGLWKQRWCPAATMSAWAVRSKTNANHLVSIRGPRCLEATLVAWTALCMDIAGPRCLEATLVALGGLAHRHETCVYRCNHRTEHQGNHRHDTITTIHLASIGIGRIQQFDYAAVLNRHTLTPPRRSPKSRPIGPVDRL